MINSISQSVCSAQDGTVCLQTIQQSSSAWIKKALLAIKEEVIYGERSLRGRVSLDGYPQIQMLLSSVFGQDEALQSASINAGYDSKQDYVVKKLTQVLWNSVQVEITRQCDWIVWTTLDSVEVAPPSNPEVLSSLSTSIELRFVELERLDKVKDIGWINTEKDELEWPERLFKWRNTWDLLKKQVQDNTYRVLFSKDPIERRLQYLAFLEKIHKVFPVLSAKDQDFDFFDFVLPELLEVCYTGWDDRINQIASRSQIDDKKKQEGFLLETHRVLGQLRDDIFTHRAPSIILELSGVEEKSISKASVNVHNLRAIRQWANAPYFLGIPSQELGEREPMFDVLAPHLNVMAPLIINAYYLEDEIRSILKQIYEKQSAEEKEVAWAFLLDEYKKAVLLGEVPYIDRFDSLRDLYDSLKSTKKVDTFEEYSRRLKKLYIQWIQKGFVPPFSALTPKELAFKHLSTSPIRLAVNRGQDLRAALGKIEHLDTSEKDGIINMINQFENSESEASKGIYLKEQKARIDSLVQNLNNHIALENCRILRDKAEDAQGSLDPFGVSLFGAMSRVFIPKSVDAKKEIQEEILDWVFRLPLPPFISESYAERLTEVPSAYLCLPEEMQKSSAVKAVLALNPNIRYGVSLSEYQKWLVHPRLYITRHDSIVKKCKEAVLAAVSSNGFFLVFADSSLKDDDEVIRAAVIQNGRALRYASKRARNTKAIVLLAISQDAQAFYSASKALRNDPEVLQAKVLKTNVKGR